MVAVASNLAPTFYPPGNSQGGRQVVPVGAESNWVEANLDPTTAQNAGSDITAIYTILASGGVNIVPILIASGATGIDLCCEYKADGTLTSPPTVVVFGLDRNGRVWRCKDAAGAYSWTLADAATDPDQSSVLGMTDAVRISDLNNAYRILVLVKTAAVGTGFAKASGGRILAKLI